MSKVNRTLMVGEDVVEVASDNLPAAAANAKGAVKQGDGVAKSQDPQSIADKKLNAVLDSLRHSGVVANDKFVVFYDKNFPQGVDEGGHIPVDENVYLSGQTATVKFVDGDERVPYCQGYNFIGWALSPSALSPTYPYDENDPQTYTVTFTDNDIVLYAVWEAKTYTITYSLGEDGTGSVPSAQTVGEGVPTELLFSPAPSVNDGSGRVFVGWATSDGASTPDYTPSSPNISVYDDITLYPVFAFTVTYSLGSYATGTVPAPAYGQSGDTVSLDFHPTVSPISGNNVFCGWATVDGLTSYSSADYKEDGATSITLYTNVVLYPVFAQTFTLSYATGSDGTGSTPANQTAFDGQNINVSFSPTPTCVSDPSKDFIGWSTSDLQSTADYEDGDTITMTGNVTLYPVFGTIAAAYITIVNNSSFDAKVVDDQDTTLLTITSMTQEQFNYISYTSYDIKGAGKNFDVVGSFTGTFREDPFVGQTCSVSGGVMLSPKGSDHWNFKDGDNGTLTITDFSS